MLENNSLELKLKQLFVRAMEGDDLAYQTFLLSAETFVDRYLKRLGGAQVPRESLADIRQEVMLSIHQKRHTYLPERPLLPWLYAVTRYRFIDHYRAIKRRPPQIPLDDIYAQDESAETVGLEEIMAVLTVPQQELLRLVKVEELPYTTVATQLNISVDNVKVRVHRIMKTLKQKLGE